MAALLGKGRTAERHGAPQSDLLMGALMATVRAAAAEQTGILPVLERDWPTNTVGKANKREAATSEQTVELPYCCFFWFSRLLPSYEQLVYFLFTHVEATRPLDHNV